MNGDAAGGGGALAEFGTFFAGVAGFGRPFGDGDPAGAFFPVEPAEAFPPTRPPPDELADLLGGLIAP